MKEFTFFALVMASLLIIGGAVLYTQHNSDKPVIVEQLLGGQSEVKVFPKLSDGKVIGFEVFAITLEGEIGHAFLIHDSFYSFKPNELIHDRLYFRLAGFSGDKNADITRTYTTRTWQAEDLAGFHSLKEKLNAKTLTNEQIEELHDNYSQTFAMVRSPEIFTKTISENTQDLPPVTWGAGKLKIEEQDIYLKKHRSYANIFITSF